MADNRQQIAALASTRSWLVPVVVTISAAAVMLAVKGWLPGPFRSSIVIWFLVVCPGLAFVPLLNVRNRPGEVTLILTVSFVVDTLIASGMLYSGAWSPWWTLVSIVVLCIVGVVLQVIQRLMTS